MTEITFADQVKEGDEVMLRIHIDGYVFDILHRVVIEKILSLKKKRKSITIEGSTDKYDQDGKELEFQAGRTLSLELITQKNIAECMNSVKFQNIFDFFGKDENMNNSSLTHEKINQIHLIIFGS